MEVTTPCKKWTGSPNSAGYGRRTVDGTISSASPSLGGSQRADPRWVTDKSSLRQQGVCRAESSVRRHQSGQHERHAKAARNSTVGKGV